MIIINPAAAGGRVDRAWSELESRLSGYLEHYEIKRTRFRGEATNLVVEAVRAGYRHFIAVGGDGTNHEVTNGIMQQTEVPSQDIVYTLFPVGTGNDWIRTHRIPRRLDRWLEMFEAGRCIRQEVGWVHYQGAQGRERRCFVNVAGLAYDAFVVQYGERHRSWIRNRFFYLLLILRCLFKYQLTRGVIEADGQRIDQKFYTINVGICRYSGGGMQLVPQADPADGRLALTYAGPVSKLGVLLNTWRFYNGSIGRHPKIRLLQVKQLRVSAGEPSVNIPVEADGEFLGYCPAEFSIQEQALTIIVPGPGQ